MRCSLGARPSSPRLSLPQGVVLLVTTAFSPLSRPGFIDRRNLPAVFGTLTSSDNPQQQHLRTDRAAHLVMMMPAAAATATAAAAGGGGSTTSAEKLGGYARLLRGEFSLDAVSALDRLVPELGGDKHKGQLGRVGVFGGSKDYTGAPFFASMSALRAGADLAYVFTAEEAAPALKAYSPELMVTPVYSTDWLSRPGSKPYGAVDHAVGLLLPKVHSLLIGPGMGRHPAVLGVAAKIVQTTKTLGLPVVLDADCLAMVVENPKSVRGLPLAVLTPNGNEFRLLCERMETDTAAAGRGKEKESSSSSSPAAIEAAEAAAGAAAALEAAAAAAGAAAAAAAEAAADEAEAAAAAEEEAAIRPTALTAAATEGGGVGGRADAAAVAEEAPAATTAAATATSAAAAAVGDGKGQLKCGQSTRRREAVAAAAVAASAAVVAAAAAAAQEEQRARKVERLAKFLGGVTVVAKGKVDIISNGDSTIACAVPGGLKRCGGIGDVLSGEMATLLAWVAIQKPEKGKKEDKEEESRELLLWASWWACALTRHASRKAYEDKGRAMSATNVFEHLGGVLEEVAPSPPVED